MIRKTALLLIIFVVCMLFTSCEIFKDFNSDSMNENSHDDHMFEYIAYESGHFKQYTCGCPSPEIMGMHIDEDRNANCDICDYTMDEHEHIYEWFKTEGGHCMTYLCGCAYDTVLFAHVDDDDDAICDMCEYELR